MSVGVRLGVLAELKTALGRPLRVPIAARIALDGAVMHTRLARRSYRVAVPQFYRGSIQLLLPLYLRDTSRADLALTLERHGTWC